MEAAGIEVDIISTEGGATDDVISAYFLKNPIRMHILQHLLDQLDGKLLMFICKVQAKLDKSIE